MKNLNISSFNDLISLIDKDFLNMKSDLLWWRGQPDYLWPLIPSVFRRSDSEKAEPNLITLFKTKAPTRYNNCPSQNDIQSWLFLMQHYRLPTRLLDWSESILIAAYFAVADERNLKKPGALWALNPFLLNENQFAEKIVYISHAEKIAGLFTKSTNLTDQENQKVCAILPDEVDTRMMVQQSSFTLHGNNEPLENLKSSSDFLLKFLITVEAKEEIYFKLSKLGIRESNIFPDLEYLAKDLKNRKYGA